MKPSWMCSDCLPPCARTPSSSAVPGCGAWLPSAPSTAQREPSSVAPSKSSEIAAGGAVLPTPYALTAPTPPTAPSVLLGAPASSAGDGVAGSGAAGSGGGVTSFGAAPQAARRAKDRKRDRTIGLRGLLGGTALTEGA